MIWHWHQSLAKPGTKERVSHSLLSKWTWENLTNTGVGGSESCASLWQTIILLRLKLLPPHLLYLNFEAPATPDQDKEQGADALSRQLAQQLLRTELGQTKEGRHQTALWDRVWNFWWNSQSHQTALWDPETFDEALWDRVWKFWWNYQSHQITLGQRSHPVWKFKWNPQITMGTVFHQ